MQHEFLGLLLSAKTLLRHHYASSSLHSCLKDNPPYSIFSRPNVFPMLLKTSSIPCHSHVRAKLLQSDFCDPANCSPSGSSDHGILQARILEWVACPPPGDLPDPGIKPRSPALQAGSKPTGSPVIPMGLGKKEFSFLIPSKAPPIPPNSLLSPPGGD